MYNVPIIDVIATGKNIKKLMVETGTSISQVQEVVGFRYPTTIYKWIRGDGLPSIDNLVILADILGMKIDDIVVTRRV